jgi:N-acetyl-1-D-myo-inositol-2-amino-2-deoxy-alpha-D-glucopyranoside deacetylase
MSPRPGLLCVHAHPDDEALFTGGILARYHDEGARTAVVTCTWREGTRRVAELRRSLGILGAGAPRLLGFGDAGMDQPERFVDAPFDVAVGRLVAHLREFRPEAVVTYDAFGTYGHPDHVHAHRVTLAAVEAAGYPQLYPEAGPPWRPAVLYQATFPRSAIGSAARALGAAEPQPGPGVPGVPDERIAVAVDVRDWLERKWSALLAHESEIERGAGAARFIALPERVREAMLGTEWFLRTDLADPATTAPALALGRPVRV